MYHHATLPIYLFFFLGIKHAIPWIVATVLALVLTVLNSHWAWVIPLYKSDLLILVTLDYLAISYFIFMLERERQGYEESLNSANKDKEVLLKEVHHRTKNNMQVMIGLLDMQSSRLNNSESQKIFDSHIKRLKTMSLLHKHLSSGVDDATVDVRPYLEEIITNMAKFTEIRIKRTIETVMMEMKGSTNMGLIINEALANAIEHAYPDGYESLAYPIEITLRKKGKECYLSIQDYGQGYDTTKKTQTLGLVLIEDLAKSLPNGKISIDAKEGTHIMIYFTA